MKPVSYERDNKIHEFHLASKHGQKFSSSANWFLGNVTECSKVLPNQMPTEIDANKKNVSPRT